MQTDTPKAAYDAIAEWYNASVRAGSLIHDLVLPDLWASTGDVVGRRICDLACGQGIIARGLAERGATVVGVDVSAKLLSIARREEETAPLGIVYERDDAQALRAVPDAAFDGVVCNMALMDIPDLAVTFRAVRRVLRPAGWFVFSITHPCFQTPSSYWHDETDGAVSRAVRTYFAEGLWQSENRTGVRGQVGAYHRTLSTYVNALSAAGLPIEQMREPRVPERSTNQMRGYRDIPAVLIARCRASNNNPSAPA